MDKRYNERSPYTVKAVGAVETADWLVPSTILRVPIPAPGIGAGTIPSNQSGTELILLPTTGGRETDHGSFLSRGVGMAVCFLYKD